MGITIEKQGRRHYLRGLPFELRHQAKDAGCKWDPAERAWWTGKRPVAEKLAEQLADKAGPASNGNGHSNGDRNAGPGEDATVAGRAKYKGKTYYVAGRIVRGRTHWDDGVDAVTTRDGNKVLLYFRDGSRKFWADRGAVQIVKTYDRPKTIAALREFADRAKRGEFRGSPGGEYCYGICPVGRFKCCPENGPCHDCE